MATKRPSFPKVSAEMQHFAALLESELRRWPGVRVSKMFGMVSVYRGDTIFALLPSTRGLFSADSIAIKREKWDAVEVDSEADLPTALHLLQDAFSRAKPAK